jgi:hypothetical protein
MNSTRSAIDAALFTLLQNCYAWSYSSQFFLNWSKVDVANQPAMFLRRYTENVQQVRGYSANKYELHYYCIFYVRVDNSNQANPYVVINPILDALDKAVLGPPGFQNNLGGLVDNVRMNGDIQIDDGTVDGQAAIVVPIVVVTGTN